jgi:SWI/SNF-related matrix-associated actin-dependent regulator of chromatin subfamily A-like protein 1
VPKKPPKKKLQNLAHQVAGTNFLRANERAALFDEQGLGKSKQLIDAISADVSSGVIAGALIVCPNTLKSTWASEIEQHSTLPYAVFGAGRTARRQAFRSLRACFYVINYEAVAAELPSLRALLRFKRIALVLDESHRIKTPTSKVTQAVHALRGDAARRYALTGTPVANKPQDLWSQMFFLDDGNALGASFEEFQAKFCSSSGGYLNMEELRERIAKLSLRRTKAEALTLSPKTFEHVHVELGGKQARMYRQMRNELAVWVQSLSGEEVLAAADSILARMVRLAQLASNPRLLDEGYRETPAKFKALDELLGAFQVQSKQKAIVWTSFVGNIPAIMERHAHLQPVCLHGEMHGPERDRAVHLFRNDESVRLLVANPAAAREGLTLTSANVAIYLDRTFNLVDFLQSQDRIHRISQTLPCHIVVLSAANTIDEFIEFSLSQKHRLARFAQRDVDDVTAEDLELRKPDVLRALLGPVDNAQTPLCVSRTDEHERPRAQKKARSTRPKPGRA